MENFYVGELNPNDYKRKEKRASIRIDVVNDYPGNVVPFWEKLGFAGNETITLEWGNKKSNAVVMRKSL